jgi:hypothetical protein
MRKKISVIGEGVEIAQDLSRAVDVGADVRGADVVVLAGDGDLAQIARSAPAAAVVITGEDIESRCKETYDRLLFPCARIVGVPDPARVSDVVESIIFELEDAHDVVAMKDGEFAQRSARLGRTGIRELL